jgi:hypothetical protein
MRIVEPKKVTCDPGSPSFFLYDLENVNGYILIWPILQELHFDLRHTGLDSSATFANNVMRRHEVIHTSQTELPLI